MYAAQVVADEGLDGRVLRTSLRHLPHASVVVVALAGGLSPTRYVRRYGEHRRGTSPAA